MPFPQRFNRWAKAAMATATALVSGCAGQQLLNSLTIANNYTRHSEVVFDAGTELKLDVYQPDNAANAPVVVFFYGGRWSSGNKNLYEFVGGALAKQGFVAVVPDYRLYPAVRFPTFVEDSAKAVRWAHDHARQYGGDVGRLFVMGHSAGAYNAAMLALDGQYLKAQGGSRAWLKGMIGLAGPYDFLPINDDDLKDIFGPPARYESTQPINHVDGQNPPLLLLHGENDDAVWPKNTRNLATKVREAGGVAETVLYPKMSHTWIVATLSQPLQGQSDVMAYVRDFVLRKSGLKPDVEPMTSPKP